MAVAADSGDSFINRGIKVSAVLKFGRRCNYSPCGAPKFIPVLESALSRAARFGRQ